MAPYLRNRKSTLVLLLRGSSSSLGSLLLVASDHDDGEERSDNGGADEDEDDGDADGPDTGQEEVLERVIVIDKGLQEAHVNTRLSRDRDRSRVAKRTINSVQME